ncbi:transcriptional regulator, XRE family, partial [mine drainage metagenome]
MPITQQELGRRLKTAREAIGLTQDDVAARLDVSRSAIAQMELGNRAVSSLELDRLAHIY